MENNTTLNFCKTFCPPNITFNEIWVNHGMSKCFMDTVSTTILSMYIIIFGSFQLWMYRQYGTNINPNVLPKSKLYNLQKFCLYFVPILSVARIVLQATLLDDRTVYGYMLLTTILTMISYPYSVYVLRVERHRLLPSVPPRGHGLVLLGFWTQAFVFENLVFINIGRIEWWFHLNTLTDQIEMALFVLRYVSSLLIFALGLRAPGIAGSSFPDYQNLNDGQSQRYRYYQGRQDDNSSTWKNAWYKVKTLAPFLWPKTDFLLQVRVLFCFILLASGRVINLYVPIYNKKIVDSVSATPLQFRWDLVLIYVGFKFLQGGGTGGMGVLNNLRSFMWIRIQQYTTREVEIELFRHLHTLSLRWHLGRKTGEVLRVMDRGTDSINNLLNYILFSILPTIVDIIIAVIFFVSAFNKWFGLIVFSTMVLYIDRAIQKNFVDMENMFELLREEQEVIDAPGAGPLIVKRGQVEFSNITFSYTPERLVLKNVSFVAPAGKTIALVGPSGAGKSTIMRLLFRFYDVDQGSIVIDGQNLKTVKQDTLRSAIGVVPQDTVLFNNSIKYNIQYGKIDAPEADIVAAAKYADIHERILSFPEGYETQVGERGLRLSGGEKQRVAIARTILKAPKIVLLDEATSALDTETERNIQSALNRVCADRTTIIIAHRLSTIIHADEILVLKEGEIVERGKHEDLISFGGVYQKMWEAQLRNNVDIDDPIQREIVESDEK
ncbi:ATP-binding cassette sub-family B member 6, mitochondrial [Belonocnema kinseyi]|uniref:ATP-binding cassette sub-family B member 6, mitochondrial n=1 Tax=Belonocnema kinseyi TaxID=2817044 RepID=UPI00143D40D3|nr:ATP-binding cassette sub-family B member 6, mitochondrial [Belonocnema kinseyi]